MTAAILPEVSALLESLPLHAALLDLEGRILSVNAAWREFTHENGGQDSLGSNYLDHCDDQIRQGFHTVVTGIEPRYTHEYPCHSPEVRRFFRMDVTKLRLGGQDYLLVTHQNITAQRLVELQVRTVNAALAAHSELLSQYTFATTHTLQEPLRRLTATATGLQELVGDDERMQRYAQINATAAQQMSALLDSLGQYARVGQDTNELPVRFDLRAALLQEASAQGLQAVIGDLPDILIGPQHAQTLISNLLANFTDLRAPGEVLHVQGVQEGDFVHLHFRLAALTEQQASDAMKLFQSQGHAALGLSNMLAQQYGGRMWTESGGASIGLHFTLPAWRDRSLPLPVLH